MSLLNTTIVKNLPSHLFEGVGDSITGTDANEVIYGSYFADVIHGAGGDDRIFANAGNDRIFGDEGNDTLAGDAGDDLIDGGTGNDILYGGQGADQNIGGDGYDTLAYTGSSSGVSVNLLLNQGIGGDAQGDTFSGIEKIFGSSFNDTLISDSSFGVNFDGGAGNDGIRGGAGLDVLTGGSGDDWLEGGRNIDVLTGGSGADTFVFNFDDGPDLVYDFQPGVDVIALGDGFAAPVLVHGIFRGSFGSDGELRTGTDVSEALVFGSHYQPRDELYYDTDDHQLYQLSANLTDYTVKAELLATFANDVQLHTSDFIFV
jgi:Ca2+-binding RTX toxin-like protein